MHADLPPYQQYLTIERSSDDWITGTEPMTLEQKMYLKTLTQEAGESFDDSLSKASAEEHIKRLQQQIGQKI
ncbi:MAG TPA: DUF3072 domain-containing protein [Parafilimonas sp.]|nr:DUF3072 domain-containing protein [Parafilimonas sp.]